MFDVTLYLPAIKGLARTVSSCRFDDLVSVGVIAAYRAHETYAPHRGEFSKFLGTVVWREMVKFCYEDRAIRPPCMAFKSRKAFTAAAVLATRQIGSLSDGDLCKEKKSDYDEREGLLPDAISSLPENERHLIQLRYYHGLSFRSISDETGKPISHVMRIHGAALLRLKEAVDG